MKRVYTLFVVDDSTMVLDGITQQLKRELNCRVYAFTNAEECIRHLELEPDLILTDLNLNPHHAENKISGDQLIELIREDYPQIPVIVYSSKKSFEQVLKMMKLGARDFIPKEMNFLNKLSSSVCDNLKVIRSGYREQRSKQLILFSCFLLSSALLILNVINQYVLMYIMIFMLIFWFLFVFVIFEFRNKINHPGKLHHNTP